MVRLLLNHLVDFTLFSLSENGFELVLYISNDVFIHRLMSKSTMNKKMTMWRKRQLRSSSPPHRALPSRPKVLNRSRPSWTRKLKIPIDQIRRIVFHRGPRQTQYLHCHHYPLLLIGKGSSFKECSCTWFEKKLTVRIQPLNLSLIVSLRIWFWNMFQVGTSNSSSADPINSSVYPIRPGVISSIGDTHRFSASFLASSSSKPDLAGRLLQNKHKTLTRAHSDSQEPG